jgi:hypothetical protein
MKKKPGKKNPHAVALGRLGGRVRSPPQRASSAPRPPEKLIETVIAAICARFGDCAISLGDGGIRFAGSR